MNTINNIPNINNIQYKDDTGLILQSLNHIINNKVKQDTPLIDIINNTAHQLGYRVIECNYETILNTVLSLIKNTNNNLLYLNLDLDTVQQLILKALITLLQCPDYCEANLDALYDCMSDNACEALSAEKTLLVLSHLNCIENLKPYHLNPSKQWFESLIDTLYEGANSLKDNHQRTLAIIQFW
jgi:RNAse (barnase) inhibitor barstar